VYKEKCLDIVLVQDSSDAIEKNVEKSRMARKLNNVSYNHKLIDRLVNLYSSKRLLWLLGH
jgi:hypothetical protein